MPFKHVLLLWLWLCAALYATPLSMQSAIAIDDADKSFAQMQREVFAPFESQHVNLGFSRLKSVWLRLDVTNPSLQPQDAVLSCDNPLLQRLQLYTPQGKVITDGMLHVSSQRHSINPAFHITLPPQSSARYYLHITNKTTALQFSLTLSSPDTFASQERWRHFFITLFIGAIIAFGVYAFSLYLYTREASYLYYLFYIFTLFFQQLTYVGFLPLYAPQPFTRIDDLLVVPKVGVMIIAAILFAKSFLRTEQFKRLHRTYNLLIGVVALEIALFSWPGLYLPESVILTGLFFIFFNLYAGITVYRKGNRQARFFIAGWSFLLVAYFLSIIDALGVVSIMYHLPSLVMLCTLFEALFLLLAFIDKIKIMQDQKERSERLLFQELRQRNTLIEEEVTQRTRLLQNLYRELHHRVKNNLQLIISIIKLQGYTLEDDSAKEAFVELENRIRSIAKSHEMLFQNDNDEHIDMAEYITGLSQDIQEALSHQSIITFTYDIGVHMPLREAVYVGLIINELVANTFKHALTCKHIAIALQRDHSGAYLLSVADDGEGYDTSKRRANALGLKLVESLVYEQLRGTMLTQTQGRCAYEIRFSL